MEQKIKRIRELLDVGFYIEDHMFLDLVSEKTTHEYNVIDKDRDRYGKVDEQTFSALKRKGIITPYVSEFCKTIYGIKH